MPRNESMTKDLSSDELLVMREEVVAGTQEYLGRAATLFNTIRQNFPYTTLEARTLEGDCGQVKSRMLTTPKIVLPARQLRSFEGDERNFVRRSATDMTFYYDYPKSESLGLPGITQAGALPVPDEIYIAHPRPIAIEADSKRSKDPKYQYSDRYSISGHELDLFSWVAHDFGASLPYRTSPAFDSDELRDFATFRGYPDEALVLRPDGIDFHNRRLGAFKAAFGEVALAVMDNELNPR